MLARRVMTAPVLLGVAIAFAVGWVRLRELPRSRDHAPVGWPLGVERTYACELATRAHQPSGGELVDLRMKGRLSLTVIATSPALVVRARYTGDTLLLGGSATGSAEVSHEVVRRSLTHPIDLTYRATGELAGVHVDPDTIPFVTGLFRELGAAARISAPRAPGNEWQVTEEDAGGTYVVRYRVVAGPRAAPRSIAKHKQGYVHGATTVISSTTELEFEDTRALRSVRSHETLLAARGPLPEIEVTTELKLDYLASTDRRSDPVGWLHDHTDDAEHAGLVLGQVLALLARNRPDL